MLKIFIYLLVIIGLYITNSISIVYSQNDGCKEFAIGAPFPGQPTPYRYECDITNAQDIEIILNNKSPSAHDTILIGELPLKGSLYSYPYDENSMITSPNFELGDDNQINYVPSPEFNGQDRFTYYVQYYDGNTIQNSNKGTVIIKGNPIVVPTDPNVVPSEIVKTFEQKYKQYSNKLGVSISEEINYDEDLPGYESEYEKGIILYNLNENEFYVIYGSIFYLWNDQVLDLGYPISNIKYANRTLTFQDFENGIIYHILGKESILVDREIYEKWKEYGGEDQLGYPISNLLQISNNDNGWYQEYEKGVFYWKDYPTYASPIYKQNHEKTELREISGKWYKLGDVKGLLGFPVSNVKETVDTSNVKGFFQEFNKGKQDGAIYYVNGSTNEVHGGIYAKWKKMEGEKSSLGYPISDEFSIKKIKDGKQSNFTNGILYWNPSNNEVLANYTKNK